MKLATIISFSFLFISTQSFAQTNLSIGIHSGVLFSAFEDQDETQTAIPVGGYFGMQATENVEVGIEFNTSVIPFEEKFSEDFFDITQSITQSVFGGYVRLYFPSETIVPYIRAGVAYYTGAIEYSAEGIGFDFDLDGALGFNIGAGIGTESGLYAEFIYHIVSQNSDAFGEFLGEDIEDSGFNNFGAHIGYSFSIN